MSNKVKVSIMGCGTVGSAVNKAIRNSKREIRRRTGLDIEVHSILVDDMKKARGNGVDTGILTDDFHAALEGADIVAYCVPGDEVPYMHISEMIELDLARAIITPNKIVMANHPELFGLALEHKVNVLYGAAAGGSLELPNKIAGLAEQGAIVGLKGLTNGTTNDMLTTQRLGWVYQRALARAQKKGYAEPDPTSDVEDHDNQYKIALLASLAFNAPISPADVYARGITSLSRQDFIRAEQTGYVIKMLSIAERTKKGYVLGTEPMLIPKTHWLANVDNNLNALCVEMEDGYTLQIGPGPGAGPMPTARAVVNDIIRAAKMMQSGMIDIPTYFRGDKGRIVPQGEVESKFYIGVVGVDESGTLADIAAWLTNKRLNIASINQEAHVRGHERGWAPIAITTKPTTYANISHAVAGLETNPRIQSGSKVSLIRIL